ncbi:response regulator [Vibrio vulnificus]|uniref:response regulator n=1 Tax=Vibrio vulnificus TaxID=672 RepID=UPI001CDC6A1A|nr:response regulator [Vibrio vulnificus]MCA3903473.1 response regulator [Vibrio vulnificus]
MKILVIDDKAKVGNHTRTILLEALKTRQGVAFDIIEPNEDALKEKLTTISDYNLVLIDFRFDQPGTAIFKSGVSLYSLIRSYSSSIPIYLISVLKSTTNQIGDFDLFINDEKLKEHNLFKQEVADHMALKNCFTIESFLKLLHAPEDIIEDLTVILKPIFNKIIIKDKEDEIPKESISQSLNLNVFQWISQTFIRKQGFLVGKEGAALILGISTEYFDKISEKFKDARYKGLFFQSFDERWWVTLLYLKMK